MSGHTPGPWQVATSNSWRRIVSIDGTSVCEPTVYSRSDPHPDLYFRNGGADGPDARLVAAAPDLLQAARDARGLLSLHGCPVDWLDSVILKATGEAA